MSRGPSSAATRPGGVRATGAARQCLELRKLPHLLGSYLGCSELLLEGFQSPFDPTRLDAAGDFPESLRSAMPCRQPETPANTASWGRSASLPSKGIGPVALDARKAGPGHFVANGATFGASGDWQIQAQARVSDFDAYFAKVGVPIR